MGDHLRPFGILCIIMGSLVTALSFPPCRSLAEEAVPPQGVEQSARERDLWNQLQKILHELDELQQQPGSPAPPPPPAVVQESIEPEAVEAVPQYELADVSIVSDRVQRRPEGLSLAATELGLSRGALYRRMEKHGL